MDTEISQNKSNLNYKDFDKEFDNDEDEENDNDNDNDNRTIEDHYKEYNEYEIEIKKIHKFKSLVKSMNEKLNISPDKSYKIADIIRTLVSKNKSRFTSQGFNLDLSYITERIIAMAYPSEKIESLYRNPLSEVQKFFNTFYKGHYKIYNLCSERKYPDSYFEKISHDFVFEDHNPPPFHLIYQFCLDASQFLNSNQKNIIGVHCKAGKGRTGVMITSLLLFLNIWENPTDALIYYGLSRTQNGKGTTIPSQIRYIYYFSETLKQNISMISEPLLIIQRVRFITVPKISGDFLIYIEIKSNKKVYSTLNNIGPLALNSKTPSFEIQMNEKIIVQGDVEISIFQKRIVGSEKLFSLWIHTFFVNINETLIIGKNMLDKAWKDKEKLFDKNFRFEIDFHEIFEESQFNNTDLDIKIKLEKLAESIPDLYRKLSY